MHKRKIETQNSIKPQKPRLRKAGVIGSCFCGEQGIIVAFGETFCQKHNDELAKSFEARMCDRENNYL